MTIEEMRTILSVVEFEDYRFEVKEKNGVPFLRAVYVEPDIVTGEPETQHTRKWQLSEHMVKSEIVQTAFKCVMTSLEHRARENFKYRGRRVFGPHFDVDALWEIAGSRLDYRGRASTAEAN
jgi:hypothetical protein